MTAYLPMLNRVKFHGKQCVTIPGDLIWKATQAGPYYKFPIGKGCFALWTLEELKHAQEQASKQWSRPLFRPGEWERGDWFSFTAKDFATGEARGKRERRKSVRLPRKPVRRIRHSLL